VKYSPDMIAWLRENAPGRDPKETAALFNAAFGTSYSAGSVKCAMHNRRILTGRDCRFKKGHATHNKGRRGLRASPSTEFRPGHVPANARPVGAERLAADGYWRVKVAPNAWRHKHRVAWEAAHGPIPPGHAVIFADGDRGNFSPGNLAAVPRGTLATLNKLGLKYGDQETLGAAVLVAELIQAIAARARAERRRKKGGRTR
jgi:hypothetical protein